MRYPLRNPYLIYRRIGEDEYLIENLLYSESYTVNYRTALFLRSLDGKTDPYTLLPGHNRKEVMQLMERMRKCNMLARKKKPVKTGTGSYMWPLVYCFPQKSHKYPAIIWNCLLMLLFLPVFITGLYLFYSKSISLQMDSYADLFAGMMLGAIPGMIFHELSHACAGLTYNGHLFEMGIGISTFLPMGYIALDTRCIKSRAQRIQTDAAGIEMNLLLSGMFYILSSMRFIDPFVMYLAAIINLVFAVFNALPLYSIDGLNILSAVIGKDDALKYAVELIMDRKKRKESPLPDAKRWHLFAAYALIGFQAVLPLTLLYELYSVWELILILTC